MPLLDLTTYSDDSTDSMFRNKRYAHALIAFRRAACPRGVAVCGAYLLREKARSQSGAPREKTFIEAAEAFNTCAQEAQTLENEDGDEDERRLYYTIAGDCFSEGDLLRSRGVLCKSRRMRACCSRIPKGGPLRRDGWGASTTRELDRRQRCSPPNRGRSHVLLQGE